MTFRQFDKWCNKRCEDGHWSLNAAVHCGAICDYFLKKPWYNREREWKKSEAKKFAEILVRVVEEKYDQLYL